MSIQLFPDTKAGIAGTIKLRWCVPRDVLQELRTRPEEIWLLISVVAANEADDSKPQRRQAVPLKDGVTLVSFRKAGSNRIFAKTFFGTKAEAERALNVKQFGVTYQGDNWSETSESVIARIKEKVEGIAALDEELRTKGKSDVVLASKANLEATLANARSTLETTQALERFRGMTDEIIVPEESFASEWPTWVTHWMSYFKYDGRPLDQCNRRKRAILAFTAQPIAVLLDIIVRIFLLFVGIVIGPRLGAFVDAVSAAVSPIREKTWSALPFNEDNGGDGAPFWVPIGDSDAVVLRLLLLPFAPLAIVLSMLCMHTTRFAEHGTLLWVLAGMVGVLAFEVALAAVIGIIWVLWNYGGFANPFRWLSFFLTGPAKISEQDMEALACTGDCPPDPAKEKRTIRLWYLETKQKVCKPIQG